MDKTTEKVHANSKITGAVIVAVVAVGLSFYGGMQYQKSRATSAQTANTASNQNGRFANGMRRQSGVMSGQRPAMGQVTAISSSSITVQDAMQYTAKTYKITSSTKVTNGGNAANVSDVKTGDRVLVLIASSSSSDASQIEINPSMPSGNPGQRGGPLNE